MFVDVCFPNNDEERYIEMGRKLSTKRICFVYGAGRKCSGLDALKAENSDMILYGAETGNKKRGNLVFYSFPSKDVIKEGIYFIKGLGSYSSGFASPLREVTQVHIKELKTKGCLIGFPASEIVSQENPFALERFSFLLRLCIKYRVDFFFASFASAPYSMRSERALKSLFSFFVKDKGNINRGFRNLGRVLDGR